MIFLFLSNDKKTVLYVLFYVDITQLKYQHWFKKSSNIDEKIDRGE